MCLQSHKGQYMTFLFLSSLLLDQWMKCQSASKVALCGYNKDHPSSLCAFLRKHCSALELPSERLECLSRPFSTRRPGPSCSWERMGVAQGHGHRLRTGAVRRLKIHTGCHSHSLDDSEHGRPKVSHSPQPESLQTSCQTWAAWQCDSARTTCRRDLGRHQPCDASSLRTRSAGKLPRSRECVLVL